MAKAVKRSARDVPLNSKPVKVVVLDGQALVIAAPVTSEVENAPPPSSTVRAGQVAVAATWLPAGLSTVEKTVVYRFGAVAHIAWTTKSAWLALALL
jgi:hypothetical protein